MRRAVVLIALVVALLMGSTAAQVPAGTEPTSTTTSSTTTSSSTTVVQVPTGNILPMPNSGVAPSEPGDRGGALQIGLFFLVVLAIAGAVLALVRQSRRAKGVR